jgi:hypothetical protein
MATIIANTNAIAKIKAIIISCDTINKAGFVGAIKLGNGSTAQVS